MLPKDAVPHSWGQIPSYIKTAVWHWRSDHELRYRKLLTRAMKPCWILVGGWKQHSFITQLQQKESRDHSSVSGQTASILWLFDRELRTAYILTCIPHEQEYTFPKYFTIKWNIRQVRIQARKRIWCTGTWGHVRDCLASKSVAAISALCFFNLQTMLQHRPITAGGPCHWFPNSRHSQLLPPSK